MKQVLYSITVTACLAGALAGGETNNGDLSLSGGSDGAVAAMRGDNVMFQAEDAPRCIIENGRTKIQYTSDLHTGFHCTHDTPVSGAPTACSCTTNYDEISGEHSHPTAVDADCMTLNDRPLTEEAKDCTDAPVGPVPAVDWTCDASTMTSHKIHGPDWGLRFGRSMEMDAGGDVIAMSVDLRDNSGTALRVLTKDPDVGVGENPWVVLQDIQDQGYVPTLSDDGSTMIAGGPHNGAAGKAWTYARSGATGLYQETAVIDPADHGVAIDNFGKQVAVSGDGSTAVFCTSDRGSHGSANQGSAEVYTKDSSGSWTFQQKLQNHDTAGNLMDNGNDKLCYDWVSISEDGTRIAAPVPNDPEAWTHAGAMLVFVRSGNAWTLEQKLLNREPNIYKYGYGTGGALSRDGRTLVVGNEGDWDDTRGSGGTQEYPAGSADIWKRETTDDGEEWVLETTLFSTGDQASTMWMGSHAAISDDGTVFAVGSIWHGTTDNGVEIHRASGGIWVFSKDADGVWAQRAALGSEDAHANRYEGERIDMSRDGSTIATTAYGDDMGGLDGRGHYGRGVVTMYSAPTCE
jgi:hypothetical protein